MASFIHVARKCFRNSSHHNIFSNTSRLIPRLLPNAIKRFSSNDSASGGTNVNNGKSETSTKDPAEPVKGKIFEKQPIKIQLEAGKQYFFCACGYSKNQPFCDGSHKAQNFITSRPHVIRYQPLPFTVEKTKEHWLCLCKQSNKRPFCDGTHKRSDIKAAVLS